MTRCPSCGAFSILGATKNCIWCGKTVCNKCVPNWHGSLAMKASTESQHTVPTYQTFGFCADDCFYTFWKKTMEYPMERHVGTDINGFDDNWTGLWNDSILTTLSENPKTDRQIVGCANRAVQIHSKQFPAFPWWDSSKAHTWMAKKFAYAARRQLARNVERCGRSLDAAKVLEELHMYDEARQLREKERRIIVQKTDITLDLNALLQQVKQGGIVAVYRCPHCGGKLKIGGDTNLEKLMECQYCGEKIGTMEIADFLKAILS